ncbi:187-kDa microtubule-associated protein AIR9-like isoform X2 [Rhododendron vialii]|uniref:187-kDa microtubule-associated protein AIR9-like isoform X2 n=1 Tax=Rhododendron vialii TaxID=182163 RepID=UPI00265EFC0A|nr:187-kDa microtubule-associated protein AIR9-like isoform X2 [Rhododendron vialii]
MSPPKVTNLKIIGDIREGNKVTVTGGTESSSRVQWFKSTYSTLEGENGLDAFGTSKIAKDFRIPLGAVGYFVVAEFTPMTLNGESGESAYVISERAVESKLFFWSKFFSFKVGLNFAVKMKKKCGKYQWSFIDINT